MSRERTANPAAPERRLPARLKIVGLGGVGALVAQGAVQYLASARNGGPPCEVWLIDGDAYTESNRSRVSFRACGNKAISKAEELAPVAGASVSIVPVPKFLTPGNARSLIGAGDWVLVCVDNHRSRKAVSDYCRRLADVTVIAGGNDGVDLESGMAGTFGNVMLYIRRGGRDATNPLTRFHPEIARPADKRPDQMSCEELARASAPQLLFTNMAVATMMLASMWSLMAGKAPYEEVFFDIAEGRMTPVRRAIDVRGSR